jgi:hypothetical protein
MEFPIVNHPGIVRSTKLKHSVNGRGKLKYATLIWNSQNGTYVRAKHGPIGMEKRLANAQKADSLENKDAI